MANSGIQRKKQNCAPQFRAVLEHTMRSIAHFKSHPIHPMLIPLPIGLWIGSFVFDLLGTMWSSNPLRAAGFYCVVAGCVGAALAAIPGVIDLFGAVPPRSSGRKRGYIHGGMNSTILLLFIYVAWRRGTPYEIPDTTSLLLSLVGVVGIVISGWLGGTLSYRNQIGVDRRYANATKLKIREVEDFTRPVCNQAELSDGQLMLAKVGGERIAIARSGSELFAFSDHCTHRGGPLCDGALIGNVVQCPWHGSQFDCRTGRVVAGPAETHIRTYQIDVRNNEVYVRDPREISPQKAA